MQRFNLELSNANQVTNFGEEFLNKLKTLSHQYHSIIEKKVKLLYPDVSIAFYKKYIEQLYGFYLPLENKLSHIKELQSFSFAFKKHWKTPLLKKDLHAFNIKIDKITLCNDLPELSCLPKAVGCCYVLEGASLGGQFIFRHLKHVLSIKSDKGYSYLIGWGDDTVSIWNFFKEALINYVLENAATEEVIIAGAAETFFKMQLWLEKICNYDE